MDLALAGVVKDARSSINMMEEATRPSLPEKGKEGGNLGNKDLTSATTGSGSST